MPPRKDLDDKFHVKPAMLEFMSVRCIIFNAPFFFLYAGLAGTVASATETTTNGVTLHGAGATFPDNVYVAWMAAYRSSRLQFVDVKMTYAARGSGYGKTAILNPQQYDIAYAGSDSVLSEADYQTTPDLQLLPSVAGLEDILITLIMLLFACFILKLKQVNNTVLNFEERIFSGIILRPKLRVHYLVTLFTD